MSMTTSPNFETARATQASQMPPPLQLGMAHEAMPDAVHLEAARGH